MTGRYPLPPLQTGQRDCYDRDGATVPCHDTGQDGENRHGCPWPLPRFEASGSSVIVDRLTGLVWSRDANPAGFPLNWYEALDYIDSLNRDHYLGHSDWRLPNRRELRSLLDHQPRRIVLSEGHPFENLFPHWYWSSTTVEALPDHAWYVHLDGGRMFYGGKDQAYMVWPLRGENSHLPQTGQRGCYRPDGVARNCGSGGQDGDTRHGIPWPSPRFDSQESGVVDRLTGLVWHPDTDLAGGAVDWLEALETIKQLNGRDAQRHWRLPNINELESLVDCSRFAPALPAEQPFGNVEEIYWSSTTSSYEPDWAWALYLEKGAVGVGQKGFARFFVWAVSSMAAPP